MYRRNSLVKANIFHWMLCDALSAVGLEITMVNAGMSDFNMRTEKIHSKSLRKETCPVA